MSLSEGTRLGTYEILALIGAGGMGEVYRARDPKLGRDVAIKVLPESFAENKDRLVRFEREARLLASLNHPKIAAIYDLAESEGIHFLVLEFVPGENLAEQVSRAQVTYSDSGTLVYVPGGDLARGVLARVSRRGETEFLPVPERLYGVFDLSPDGKRLAIHVADITDYIWIYDVSGEEGRRLTADGATGWPVWSPDAAGIVYSERSGNRIVKRVVDSQDPPEELFSSVLPSSAASWSPDGRTVAIYEVAEKERIGFILLDGHRVPEWLPTEGSTSFLFAFSPNGRWLACTSAETGRWEIWIRSYPDGETVRQISVDGGAEPVWCDACGELFWRKGNQWMSVSITLEPELSWESPRLAFETDFIDTLGRSYDVSPDGQHLIVAKRTQKPTRTKLHVVHNWFEELKRPAPNE